MRPWQKILIPVLAVIALLGVGLFVLNSTLKPTERPQASLADLASLPDFDLYGFANIELKSHKFSELKGKLFIINFWASWCDACIEEMPSIVSLYNEFKDQGLEVIGVNVDENPDRVVPPILQKLGMKFPIIIDKEQKLSDLFDVSAIPLTAVVDKNRRILKSVSGEHNWNSPQTRSQIKEWLQKP